MCPESVQHQEIKNIMEEKFRNWYGASINEYYDSGHELDVYAITPNNVKIYLEVIWNPSLSHVRSDMLILERSEAEVKIVVANPEIIQDSSLVREYNKSVMSLRKKGVKIWGVMLNGVRILENPGYVDIEVKQIIDSLLVEMQDFQEYNYEVDVFDIIEHDGVEERTYDAPLIEILIGSISQPSNWLSTSQLNSWIISSIDGARQVIPRRHYFECQSYGENTFIRVYSNGIFHKITPFHYDSQRDTYYIDDVFYTIVLFLITSIRILNLSGINTAQYIELFLRNTAGVKMMYSRRDFIWEYFFSKDEKSSRFTYTFIPSPDWSSLTSLLLTIYKDICQEIGSVITDDIILWRVKEIMKTVRRDIIQENHSQFRLQIPGVNYEDFKFPEK